MSTLCSNYHEEPSELNETNVNSDETPPCSTLADIIDSIQTEICNNNNDNDSAEANNISDNNNNNTNNNDENKTSGYDMIRIDSDNSEIMFSADNSFEADIVDESSNNLDVPVEPLVSDDQPNSSRSVVEPMIVQLNEENSRESQSEPIVANQNESILKSEKPKGIGDTKDHSGENGHTNPTESVDINSSSGGGSCDDQKPKTSFVVDRMYQYNDRFSLLRAKQKPHENFAYKLGLEVVLANYLPQLGAQYEDLLSTNSVFSAPLHKCHLCDFESESAIVMDTHLAEPHNFKSVFKCNFCDEFKTRTKDQYRQHVELEHKRTCKMEKPFIDDRIMCSVCDFEVGKSESSEVTPADFEKLQRHILYQCPFREQNLIAPNPNLNINFREILNHVQTPSELDLLNHQFIFNNKPTDRFVNNYNLFTSSLTNTNSYLGLCKTQEEDEYYRQIRLYTSMIQEDNPGIEIDNSLRFEFISLRRDDDYKFENCIMGPTLMEYSLIMFLDTYFVQNFCF